METNYFINCGRGYLESSDLAEILFLAIGYIGDQLVWWRAWSEKMFAKWDTLTYCFSNTTIQILKEISIFSLRHLKDRGTFLNSITHKVFSTILCILQITRNSRKMSNNLPTFIVLTETYYQYNCLMAIKNGR